MLNSDEVIFEQRQDLGLGWRNGRFRRWLRLMRRFRFDDFRFRRFRWRSRLFNRFLRFLQRFFNLTLRLSGGNLARRARPIAEPDADDLEEQELRFLSRDELEMALTNGEFEVLGWATAVALALSRLAE